MSAKVEKCLKCNDQGWRPVKSSSGGVLFERCFCRAGKARAAKEYQEAMKKINATADRASGSEFCPAGGCEEDSE